MTTLGIGKLENKPLPLDPGSLRQKDFALKQTLRNTFSIQDSNPILDPLTL